MQRAEVNVRSSVIWIEFQYLLIHFDRLGLMIGIFFERDTTCEQLGGIGRGRVRIARNRRAADDPLSRRKIKHELAGNRLQHFALMAKRNAVSSGESSSFEERVLHASHLFQHGLKRLPDHGWTNLAGAQIAYFFDLQEFEKRIVFSGGDQSSFLPGCQLTRRHPENTKQIGLTVSIHDWNRMLTLLSEKLLSVASSN